MRCRDEEYSEQQTWQEKLITILGTIGIIGIITLTFVAWIIRLIDNESINPAEGSTTRTLTIIPGEDTHISGDPTYNIQSGWNSLLTRYSMIFTTTSIEPEIKEVEKEKTKTVEPVIKDDDPSQHTFKVTKAFIKYANPKLADDQIESVARSLIKWAEYYTLPVGLVVGVAHAESNFRVRAEGILIKGDRATGCMQVMWPMHRKLAKELGVSSKNDMFGDLGIKVGCYLLKTYIQEQDSIIGGLASYLSSLSRTYILEKVIVDWIVIEQLIIGSITETELPDVHQTEKNFMSRITRGRKK